MIMSPNETFHAQKKKKKKFFCFLTRIDMYFKFCAKRNNMEEEEQHQLINGAECSILSNPHVPIPMKTLQ